MSTESARKAAEQIWDEVCDADSCAKHAAKHGPRSREEEITAIERVISAACQTVAPPPAPFLYCGAEHPTLKVGCILRLGHDKHENMGDTWESGAAPAVSAPPHAYGWCQTQRDNDLCAYCEAHPPTVGAAVSTPRCPTPFHQWVLESFDWQNFYLELKDMRELSAHDVAKKVEKWAGKYVAQFFPAPSPPQEPQS